MADPVERPSRKEEREPMILVPQEHKAALRRLMERRDRLESALRALVETGQDITPTAGLPNPGSGDWARFSEAWHAARSLLQEKGGSE